MNIAEMAHRAEKLFTSFHGRLPARDEVLSLEDDVVFLVGDLISLTYEKPIASDDETYYHDFDSSSRPALYSSYDGLRLYILGGDYKFTKRGILG